MAQHRRQGIKNTRRIASTAALAATAAVVAPGVAQAAEVVVPNLSLIHISEPTRLYPKSRMPSSA